MTGVLVVTGVFGMAGVGVAGVGVAGCCVVTDDVPTRVRAVFVESCSRLAVRLLHVDLLALNQLYP